MASLKRKETNDMAPEAAKSTRHYFIDLTDANFTKVVIESKKAFIIEIRADWCGECYIMEPILRQLANEFSENITFAYVNVDTNQEITKQYGVTELPFILYFKNGELLHHLIGLQSKKKLRQYIEDTIAYT